MLKWNWAVIFALHSLDVFCVREIDLFYNYIQPNILYVITSLCLYLPSFFLWWGSKQDNKLYKINWYSFNFYFLVCYEICEKCENAHV